MARKATKAAENIYYKARIEAAATNDKLNSREGASEIIGIDRTRLARIELDSICAYPEEVLMMADIYNAPELENYFCCEQCPIGKHTVPQLKVLGIDRVTIQVLASLKNIDDVRRDLLDITSDGVITEDEKPKLKSIIKALDEISINSQELKLCIQKNLSKGLNK
ncbi:XRE family transcriptional regulator [Clostridium tyrobutyricum]|uniref:XRE family transcriptional regulator n=1 Tax=Clostridium tyrobutyricum TaxID=1519 RepID=UPI001C38C2C8|nr:XRE family transcriptional regulator [Clostridium tyrobutyricum]MBV4439407.1 XRE family transcriptional regulator [Clostridium tyrobutyricum]